MEIRLNGRPGQTQKIHVLEYKKCCYISEDVNRSPISNSWKHVAVKQNIAIVNWASNRGKGPCCQISHLYLNCLFWYCFTLIWKTEKEGSQSEYDTFIIHLTCFTTILIFVYLKADKEVQRSYFTSRTIFWSISSSLKRQRGVYRFLFK